MAKKAAKPRPKKNDPLLACEVALAAVPEVPDDRVDYYIAVAKRREIYFAELRKTEPPMTSDHVQQIKVAIEQRTGLLEKCERILGLDAESAEFRAHVIQAILSCVRLQFDPPLKDGDISKGLVDSSNAAKTAAKSLLALDRALNAVAPQYPKWLLPTEHTNWLHPAEPGSGKVWARLRERAARLNIDPATVAAEVARYKELSAIAAAHAKMHKFIAKGGAPKMLAFGALVRGLADAFKIATGRAAKVTWNAIEGRYEGRFIALVEAVLPVAEDVTVHLGTPLRYPETALLRGKFVLEHTRAGKDANKKKRGLQYQPM